MAEPVDSATRVDVDGSEIVAAARHARRLWGDEETWFGGNRNVVLYTRAARVEPQPADGDDG